MSGTAKSASGEARGAVLSVLLAGEIYALVDLATDSPDHADIIAGSMAAGVVAILIAAIQGSVRRGEDAPPPGPEPGSGPS